MIQSSIKAIQFIKGVARNAPWLMIAIVIHVIGIAIVSVIYIGHQLLKDDTRGTSIAVAAPKENVPLPVQPEERIDRKLVPKTTEAEVVSFEEETFEASEPDQEVDLHLDRGDPDSTDETPPGATGGTSFGVGNAPGHYGTGVPSGYATRRVGGGGRKGRSGGPTQGTEKAVLEGLRWLVRHQNPDGSWGVDTLRERCDPKHPCIAADVEVSANYNEGLTGLALLAFLGAGFTHESKEFVVDTAMGKKHYFGDVIKNGLNWLKKRQHEDGSFSDLGFMYNEALATMAMTEAYGISRNKFFKEPAERGVHFLINAQKISPIDDSPWGWRYESKAQLDARKAKGEVDDAAYFALKSKADTSVTGWVIMALKSAAISDIDVPPEVMQGGLRFAESVTADAGLVGYLARDDAGKKPEGPSDNFTYHTGTMTALSMLIRTFVSHDLNDPFLEIGAQKIVTDLPTISKDKLSIDYYYWYYASLALNQYDGPDSPRNTDEGGRQKYWGPWKKEMESALLELQDKNKERDVCSRGGWLIDDRWAHTGHALYNTAINTLTLEVYYRYANAFGAGQRGVAPAASQKPAK